MIMFSTTLSPDAGVEGIKALRFLFPRFYFWCKVPGVKDTMGGCPADDTLVGFAVLTGCLPPFLFAIFQVVYLRVTGTRKIARKLTTRGAIASSSEFQQVQTMLTMKSVC